jgi:hypothetical protein
MRPVRTSIRLALQDMWQFYGLRVLIGLSVAILAVVLALIATGQATPWTLWAYAIFFGGTYLICLVLRLTGWHRLWEPSHREQTSPSGHLYLQLDFKGPWQCVLPGFHMSSLVRSATRPEPGTRHAPTLWAEVASRSGATTQVTSMEHLPWYQESTPLRGKSDALGRFLGDSHPDLAADGA